MAVAKELYLNQRALPDKPAVAHLGETDIAFGNRYTLYSMGMSAPFTGSFRELQWWSARNASQ